MDIYKFEPYLKQVLWGGEKIAKRKGIADAPENVGESWEISGVPGHESVVACGEDKGLNLIELIRKHGAALMGARAYEKYGEDFPLLVKIIDAKSNLSVQVHPDDQLARQRHGCLGKTEMWYIIDTDPDAKIFAGLSQQITPDDYERMVADNTIMDAVAAHDANPGDVFFIPSGRVHAIGAGNLLAEIQETSDITYRIYDYGRKDANGNERELHTAQAKGAIDYKVYPKYTTDYDRAAAGLTTLVEDPHFKVSRMLLDGEAIIPENKDSFTIVICLDGECTLTAGNCAVRLSDTESALIPASLGPVSAHGRATLLTATA